MKTFSLRALVACSFALVGAALAFSGSYDAHFKKGSPELQSIGSIAFGPEGILFVADQKAAKIYALATNDKQSGASNAAYKVANIDSKVAAALGSSPDQIAIRDMAVNPDTRNAWLSVARGRGVDAQPVIMKVTPAGKPSVLSLKNISYSAAVLPNVPEDKITGEGRRAKNKRLEAITDMS